MGIMWITFFSLYTCKKRAIYRRLRGRFFILYALFVDNCLIIVNKEELNVDKK